MREAAIHADAVVHTTVDHSVTADVVETERAAVIAAGSRAAAANTNKPFRKAAAALGARHDQVTTSGYRSAQLTACSGEESTPRTDPAPIRINARHHSNASVENIPGRRLKGTYAVALDGPPLSGDTG
ncbi:hypothetical protein Acsp02_97030 [Actinoplanes sp. NBRC 103695]|nr:hypothetical protein Acsp02_97030 [Actinoplanes sp. NBRC 103695]